MKRLLILSLLILNACGQTGFRGLEQNQNSRNDAEFRATEYGDEACVIRTWQNSPHYPSFDFTHRRRATSVEECQDQVNSVVVEHCNSEPGGSISLYAQLEYGPTRQIESRSFDCAGTAPTPPPTPVPTPTPTEPGTCVLETSQGSDLYSYFQLTHRRSARSISECQNHVNDVVVEHCGGQPGGAIYINANLVEGGATTQIIRRVFPCAGSAPTPTPTPAPTPPPPGACSIATSQYSSRYPDFQFTHNRPASSIAECQNEVNNVVVAHCAQEPGGAVYVRATLSASNSSLVVNIVSQSYACAGTPPPTPTPTPAPTPQPTPPPVVVRTLNICVYIETPAPVALNGVLVTPAGRGGQYTNSSGCTSFRLPVGPYNFSAERDGLGISGAINVDVDKTGYVYVNGSGQLTRYEERAY